MAIDKLDALAHDLLAAVVAHMTAHAITLPDRQYVWFGQFPVDCEQLVVTWEQSTQGLPGTPDGSPIIAPILRTAQFTVNLLRCVPQPDANGHPPSDTAMDLAGTIALTDAQALMLSIVEAYKQNDFSAVCDSMSIVNVLPLSQAGRYGGVAVRIQVQI